MNAHSHVQTHARVVSYYADSPGYLTDLGGACHFGLCPPGQHFDLATAQRATRTRLGETLDLEQGSLVLDAGCGFGRVAAPMAARPFYLRVIGLDLMPARLAEARRFADYEHVPDRVRVVNGSYGVIPLRDATMDGVFTMETLCHADPLEATLAEFQRVLRPGGKLVLFEYSVPDRKSAGWLVQRIADRVIRQTGMASLEKFAHGAFPPLLASAGFENIQVEDVSYDVYSTWGWLFWRAIRMHWLQILTGQFIWRPNLAASLLIWPFRRRLRYNIVVATKPAKA